MSEILSRFGASEALMHWNATPPPTAAPENPPAPGESPFGRVLEALGDRIDRGEALVSSALRGDLGGLDAAALIAVQAGIYRYAEAVDLAAKAVDRAGNSVRTVLTGSGP